MGKIVEFKDWVDEPGIRKVSRLTDQDLGFMVALAEYVPEAVHETHYHYHKQRKTVYMVLEGNATLRLNEVEYQLKPKMVVFISPGDRHGITRVGKESFKLLEIVSPNVPDDMFELESKKHNTQHPLK